MKPHQSQIVVHLLLCCLILLGIPSKGYNCIQKGGTTVFTQNIQLSVFQPHSPDSCSHLAYFYSSSFLDCELPCCSSSSSSSSSSSTKASAFSCCMVWPKLSISHNLLTENNIFCSQYLAYPAWIFSYHTPSEKRIFSSLST